ncbi:unnamed protein product [Mytilus edulis]|uniref:Reverse transcriptase RNase H-like domain-containing protein n=1 Tax=Mytilus edulis TaxID=6550 RepID=A0A8S3R1X9_MYTED|nr:unnamed protein product [Mytilus edulis]
MVSGKTIDGIPMNLSGIVEPAKKCIEKTGILIVKAAVNLNNGLLPMSKLEVIDKIEIRSRNVRTSRTQKVLEGVEQLPELLENLYDESSKELSNEQQFSSLSFSREEGLFIIDTDASQYGIGAVLSQIQDRVEKVISYFSKTFFKPERHYCVTRKLFAMVGSIKNVHHYLYGRHFLVRTDHGALRWLMNFKNPEGQMARWLEVLGTYDFEIQHRDGRIHSNADALSRRLCLVTSCTYCTRIESKSKSEDLTNTAKDHAVRILKKRICDKGSLEIVTSIKAETELQDLFF